MKARLDVLYERYRQVGMLLESAYRNHQAARPYELAEVGALLDELNFANYRYSADGLDQLMAGKVGLDAPRSVTSTGPAPWPPSDIGRLERPSA